MIGVGSGVGFQSMGGSQFTPARLGSAVAMWYEADRGVSATSTKVTSWADQSGNGRDLLQGTDSKRPVLVQGAVGVGLPCIRFDGSDDFLSVGSVTVAQPCWICIAHKYTQQSGVRYLYSSASFLNASILAPGGGYAVVVDAAGSGGVTTSATMPTAAWHVVDVQLNGATTIPSINGTSAVAVNPGTLPFVGLCIGDAGGSSGFAALMDVYGVVILNRAPTTAERSSLLRYFARKIGVTIS
jgi:hypothetical protein